MSINAKLKILKKIIASEKLYVLNVRTWIRFEVFFIKIYLIRLGTREDTGQK